MRQGRKRRKIVIGMLCSVLLLMAVGYATFQTQFSIKGNTKITSNWDIRITNVTETNKTGSGESTNPPTWTNLTANMEADLYEKGDSVEYDITIENKGTLDAKLENIITNVKSNNEAIKISFSGYAKGEKLFKNESKIIKAKIEYNPDFNGKAEGSGEVEIVFNYTQAEGGTITPSGDTYLLTYDYKTNGGTDTSVYDEYLEQGKEVPLNYSPIKLGYEFVGWNTDKDAMVGLKSYQMPNESTTLYAIYRKPLTASYNKDNTVESISRNSDTCYLYNNSQTCEITLPEITASAGYNVDGWYSTSKVGAPTNKYQISSNITLLAKGIDNIKPTAPTIESIYNIWGSKKYSINNHVASYESDAGINGTWTVIGEDPTINFTDVSNIKNISGAYVVLESPLTKDIAIHIFYRTSGDYSEANSRRDILKAGQTRIKIPLPKGDYKGIRFDIGDSPDIIGLSYKINILGLIADNGQANDNDIIINLESKDEGSKIDHFEWVENGAWTTRALLMTGTDTSTIRYTNNRNINIPFRAIDKAGNISDTKESKIIIDKADPTLSLESTPTTNSITVVASASALSGITKYEYSKDGGTTWVTGTNNTYTFTDLTQNTTYNIKVRVTNGAGRKVTKDVQETTKVILQEPTIDVKKVSKELQTTIQNDETYPWTLENGVWKSGNHNVHDSQSTISFEFTLTTTQTISFEWTASSEGAAYDYGTYAIEKEGTIIDYGPRLGGSCDENSGPEPQLMSLSEDDSSDICSNEDNLKFYKVEKQLGPGTYTLMFGYFKDDIENGGTDRAYVKNLKLENTEATITYPSGCGNKVTCSYNINGTEHEATEKQTVLNITEDSKIIAKTVYEGAEKTAEKIIDFTPPEVTLSTSSTTKSITVSANAQDNLSEIKKYEFSINDGDWIDNGTSNVYTFNGLPEGGWYYIQVRVTNSSNLSTIVNSEVETEMIPYPTFNEKVSDKTSKVTITYPEGCGSKYTCSYIKNDEKEVIVTNKTAEVDFTSEGTVIAKISDGSNEISSVYNALLTPVMQSWSASATTDFHNSTYKSKIKSLEILDTKEVPSNAVASWDVSEKKNKSVMAYVINDPNNAGYYKLYIGGNGGVIANSDSSNAFYSLYKLETADLTLLDTSNVTSMYAMFRGCRSLTTLDLSNFDTSNVTSMNAMFSGCRSLTTLDLNSFDTSNVIYMQDMFSDCSSLTTLDLSSFDTSNVTNMSSMFAKALMDSSALEMKLTTLDLSHFDTSKVTSMSYMFYGCSSLTTLDLSHFDTSNVTSMTYMFSGCSKLTTLDVSKWNTGNVTNMSYMFNGCSSLTTLDLSHFDTSNVTSMNGMFYRCSSLTTLDLSKWNTGNVTSMGSMFNGCSSLTTLDLSHFDTSNVTSMTYMFSGCSKLTTLDVSKWNTGNVTNMSYMFNGCSSLTTLDLSHFDTAKVINMSYMFNGCSGLTTLELSKWNTGNVTNMSYMFHGCSKLTTLDVSKWNTSKVINMSYMFYGCIRLTTLDVSNFDTSKVTDMSYMFGDCRSLTTLDLSSFDTSKVTNMRGMFSINWYSSASRMKLTTLDLSSFDTSNVTSMIDMFSGCSSLTTIYSGPKWVINDGTNISGMFYECGTDHVTPKS